MIAARGTGGLKMAASGTQHAWARRTALAIWPRF